MKAYIGWSGETSKEVASILKAWLPQVNPHIQSFVSFEDVQMGSDWRGALLENLSASDCALLCVTNANADSPWLSFEAGVFYGRAGLVIPVLFDMAPSLLSAPLRMYRASSLDKKDDVRELVFDLNRMCKDSGFSSFRLNAQFEEMYPTLEKLLERTRKAQKERPAEDLSPDFAAVNRKLDAILAKLA